MAVFEKDFEVRSGLRSQSVMSRRCLNRIAGTILGVGVTSHRTLYMHTDEGGRLNVELDENVCARELQPYLEPGHRVLVAVDAADVRLDLPRCLRESNEWAGRVVLVDHERDIVTVKIRGQQVTLKSFCMDIGLGRPLRAWDSVTLTIVPDAIRIIPLGTGARLQPRLMSECCAGD